jgi:crotonobetainyl-CoA:carnitine CoA-transferase CaiB-like acyl-CoA transferase
MNSPALSSIRVLELGRVLAAPFAAQFLGDLGAEIVKVERPGVGDEFRHVEPKMKNSEGVPTTESAFFISVNRNKKSITIDLKTPEGQALVRELAAGADVLIENFKVGDLARQALDYDTLSKINPLLIYCSITGFGQSGPYSSHAAYDPIIQAMGGFMSLTGTQGDEPGPGPVRVGPSIADVMAGMTAANAILAALVQRQRTGRGQYIDIALLDSAVAALSHHAVMYLTTGEVPARLGTDSNGNAPSGMFRCADGAIMVVAGKEDQFARFCSAIDCPELPHDGRFRTRKLRIEHLGELRLEVEKYSSQLTVDEALKRLSRANIPAGRYNELPDVFEDPQVIHREMVVNVSHPLNPDMQLLANPIKMTDSVVTYRPPPLIGEHTEQILKDLLNKSESDIAALRAAGAI